MSRELLAIGSLFTASCFLLGGCSGSGRPPVAPVEGRLTYQGKPVADATVVFLCPGAPRQAVGMTDAEGNYRLTTYEPNDGATVGTHVVTVKKFKSPTDQATGPAEGRSLEGKALSKSIEESMRQTARRAAQAEKEGSLLPLKYAYVKTSGLSKEVVAGDNVINIELTD